MKKVLSLLLVLGLCFGLAGCSSDKGGDSKTDSEATKTTYETILADYTEKIKDATPTVVEEFNNEAADKKGDVNALAELSNSKVEKLAVICNEGVEKMAELKLKNGDSDDVYTEWATKLQDVYTAQAQQVTDAYMSAATAQ